ncbi:hypothetical protein LXM26_00215 [Dyadobacter sp. LJ419]|uniref:Uncharacterized protein n=1 Tax=Dyadobacter chenwenxiniae TaxID=2906456 RepID=A0A9X1PG03_9BACT|nr:hypothetical protein [Dyadobacter chenwenxiniae]
MTPLTPDECRELEESHQRTLQMEIEEEIEIYDTKGNYSHSEINQSEQLNN